jgi:hypothetical protein
MSIATLKKKTQQLYNNASVNRGPNGFSLNGTRRSQGYIGQTSLSQSLPRTLARGNTPRGAGGNNGKFVIHPAITSGLINYNDANIVKPSVLDNNGSLMTRFRWIRRGAPYSTVKPDSNNIQRTQQQHINNLQSCVINTVDKTINIGSKVVANTCTGCKNLTNTQLPSHTNAQSTHNRVVLHTKPEIAYLPMPQSSYILSLDNQCTKNNVMNPANYIRGAPLPGN